MEININPILFTLGSVQVGWHGFLMAIAIVVGVAVGVKLAIRKGIPSDEAYGPRLDQLTFSIPRENMPQGYDPQVGEMMGMETKDGRQMEAVVTHSDEAIVKLDANHPLAGKDLIFDIELVKIG